LPWQLSGWELARALCPGFFLHECNPASSTHPPFGAGLHASIGEPVSLTFVAKDHDFLHPVLQPGLCFD
jgi:hypothetical protein